MQGLIPGFAIPAQSEVRQMRKLLKVRKVALIALIYLGIILICAVCAQWIATYNPNETHGRDRLAFFSEKYLLGTDNYGRDIFSRIIYGTRMSLLGSLGIVVFSVVLGVVLGVTAGYVKPGGERDAGENIDHQSAGKSEGSEGKPGVYFTDVGAWSGDHAGRSGRVCAIA